MQVGQGRGGKLGDVTQQRCLEKIFVQRWLAPAAYNTEQVTSAIRLLTAATSY